MVRHINLVVEDELDIRIRHAAVDQRMSVRAYVAYVLEQFVTRQEAKTKSKLDEVAGEVKPEVKPEVKDEWDD